MDANNNEQSSPTQDAGFGEFFNVAENSSRVGEQEAPGRGVGSQQSQGGTGGGQHRTERGRGLFDTDEERAKHREYQEYRDRINLEANRSGAGGAQRPGGPGFAGGASPNYGLQRKTGRRRVIGGGTALKSDYSAPVKSYAIAGVMQFNDVEELRSDAISRAFAQELLEKLWGKWGLDTGIPEVMRKAEDVVFAAFAMRTASPDADFDVVVLLGDKEVNLQDLSNLLMSEEVTRRRFARAVADDIRRYVSEPDNVRLREMLVTELGVKAEYATLAFDGSTHCSGMSTNQVMFTKQLEHMNLFDKPDVRDRMASNRELATAGFQVNGRRGAYS